MKTILVPTESHEAIRPALETALMLARRFDSYIEGFALRFRVNEFVAVDMAGAIPLESLRDENFEEARRARQIFETFMGEQAVPYADAKATSLSYGWLDDAPEGEGVVGSYGRVFDIIVLARPGDEWQSPSMITLESALFESGRPVLIAPPTSPRSLGTNILVAWNNSTEQARTMADAMPFLRLAERITICTVEGATVAGPSGEQMARSLKMNGIAAEPITLKPGKRNAGETLLAKADELGCDLIVKGAYTQSRLRQMIFGGTTRHILANAKLPVLMAH